MMNFIKKKLKEEKGLTLIELLAVIVILGIIAAIAIPAIGNIIDNSRVNALKADGLNVLSAANLYYAENPNAEEDPDQDDLSPYLENVGGFGDSEFSVTKDAEGTNRLSGTASHTSGISVVFEGASVEDINAAGTTDEDSGDNLTINRD